MSSICLNFKVVWYYYKLCNFSILNTRLFRDDKKIFYLETLRKIYICISFKVYF